jgi:hypothetical protein
MAYQLPPSKASQLLAEIRAGLPIEEAAKKHVANHPIVRVPMGGIDPAVWTDERRHREAADELRLMLGFNPQGFMEELYLEALSWLRQGYTDDPEQAASAALDHAASDLSMHQFAAMLELLADGQTDPIWRAISSRVAETTEDQARALLCQQCGKGVPLGRRHPGAASLGMRPELCSGCYMKLDLGEEEASHAR